ncbi:hypothetical protein JKP88DRAFT_326902 [Tribonema minus]|uniref:Uncharacterized protein n=1 Tax=Tribonema minus TaxID=303371 RepID=A0A835YSU0_9STRA|nr:hypothetical protein JKP88DRAFT_326902 [Tribonema minus]
METYLLAFRRFGAVPEGDVQRAALRMMTYGPHGGGGGGGDVAAVANECMVWMSVAGGAMLAHPTRVAQAEGYLACAYATLARGAAGAQPVPALLRAYMLMAWTHTLDEDFAGYYAAYHRATNVAWAILSQDGGGGGGGGGAAATLKREWGAGDSAQEDALQIDEDSWVMLETLKVIKPYIVAFVDNDRGARRAFQERMASSFKRFCPRECRDVGTEPAGIMFAKYAPALEGMPSDDSAAAGPLRREDHEADVARARDAVRASQARQLSGLATVRCALQQLGRGGAEALRGAERLVHVATRGQTRLLPVLMAVDTRVVQVMLMVMGAARAGDLSTAREAGERVQRIVERLVAALGGVEGFRRPTVAQLFIAYEVMFLRLLSQDEEGCLEVMLEFVGMVRQAPGLLRWIGLRHNIHWEFRCAAVHRTVAYNLARGAARVFVRRTLLHLGDAAAATIDLSQQPSGMYMGGRAPPLPQCFGCFKLETPLPSPAAAAEAAAQAAAAAQLAEPGSPCLCGAGDGSGRCGNGAGVGVGGPLYVPGASAAAVAAHAPHAAYADLGRWAIVDAPPAAAALGSRRSSATSTVSTRSGSDATGAAAAAPHGESMAAAVASAEAAARAAWADRVRAEAAAAAAAAHCARVEAVAIGAGGASQGELARAAAEAAERERLAWAAEAAAQQRRRQPGNAAAAAAVAAAAAHTHGAFDFDEFMSAAEADAPRFDWQQGSGFSASAADADWHCRSSGGPAPAAAAALPPHLLQASLYAQQQQGEASRGSAAWLDAGATTPLPLSQCSAEEGVRGALPYGAAAAAAGFDGADGIPVDEDLLAELAEQLDDAVSLGLSLAAALTQRVRCKWQSRALCNSVWHGLAAAAHAFAWRAARQLRNAGDDVPIVLL